MRTNNVNAIIDKTQQNSKCWLCDDIDETTNNIISECRTFEQKEYKTKHDLVGMVIHWEMCDKFTFDHTTTWYMHNSESVLENETYKVLWDFEIQTDHQILTRRPDQVKINKKEKKKRKKKGKKNKENLPNRGLCCTGRRQNSIKRKRKEK